MLLDTSIGSQNIGDSIIMDYCESQLEDIFPWNKRCHIPTHCSATKKQIDELGKSKFKFLCGTNILQGDMNQPMLLWLPRFYPQYKNIILFGTGWNSYSSKKNLFTKLFYKFFLNPDILHAVRDEYTKQQLEALGVHNVICTACPTMWKLTKAFCTQIKREKSNCVVTTLTDYDQDKKLDSIMLEILIRHYDKVYLWLQGKKDRQYYDTLSLTKKNKIVLISESLQEYDSFLKTHVQSADYVGTRLHGGIRALNHKLRTIIIAVDNRSIEIAKTTNLLVIPRKEVPNRLEEMIESELIMDIRIPEENIKIWKGQFHNE